MTDKIRVGQFITQYPYPNQFSGADNYFCSGAERVAQEISTELVDLGCDVTVCTSSADHTYSIDEQDGVLVHRSPSFSSINTTQIAPTQLLDPVANNFDFDIIHVHNSTPPGVIAGWLYAKVTNTPLIITHHGGENYTRHGTLLRQAGLSLYTKFMIDSLFRSADVAVSPTEGYIEESTALKSAKQVKVIPNGVDVNEFDISLSSEEAKERIDVPSDSFLVLYVGSLHPRKGVDVLMDGFIQFQESAPNAQLVIGGSGEMKQELETMVAQMDVSSKVTLAGFIPEAKKSLYMRAADAFVLPSVTPGSEVFPLVLLEAAAARTPLIASSFDTIKSIIEPNGSGRLIKPGSVNSLTTELQYMYSNKDRREDFADNAFRMAKDRDWSEISREYLSLYREVVQ